MKTHKWFLIETDTEYQKAGDRFEKVKTQKKWPMPDVDPIELIKIRMEEFGYKPKHLSDEYGDKGTITKC
jgi:HTH-type transcriptional regulator / antitoxin HigA